MNAGKGRIDIALRATSLSFLLLTCILGAPARAQDVQDSDCDSAYNAQLASWTTYLTTPDADPPQAVDNVDPCFALLLQAQADAFQAWVAAGRTTVPETTAPATSEASPVENAPAPLAFDKEHLQDIMNDIPSPGGMPPASISTTITFGNGSPDVHIDADVEDQRTWDRAGLQAPSAYGRDFLAAVMATYPNLMPSVMTISFWEKTTVSNAPGFFNILVFSNYCDLSSASFEWQCYYPDLRVRGNYPANQYAYQLPWGDYPDDWLPIR